MYGDNIVDFGVGEVLSVVSVWGDEIRNDWFVSR